MAKKTPTTNPAPKNKACFLPLLVAGAVGFFLAVLLLKACPMMSSCPMYSEACPVTSTLKQLELALDRNDLPQAQAEANKLSEQLERTMPDLSKLAQKVAKSTSIPQARNRLADLEKKMMSDVSMPHQK